MLTHGIGVLINPHTTFAKYFHDSTEGTQNLKKGTQAAPSPPRGRVSEPLKKGLGATDVAAAGAALHWKWKSRRGKGTGVTVDLQHGMILNHRSQTEFTGLQPHPPSPTPFFRIQWNKTTHASSYLGVPNQPVHRTMHSLRLQKAQCFVSLLPQKGGHGQLLWQCVWCHKRV